jgi:peptidoglycan/xylan/chitin deacetylase (PgdA/CDA1 family)
MMGKMLLKLSMKHAAGLVAVATSPLSCRVQPGACVLMYHRVAETGIFDFSLDDWNVTPSRLENQFRWLSQNAECVPLRDVLRKLVSQPTSKPVVALTFDDGFANFHHDVLPLLKRYAIPATLFVVTRHVGSTEPYPFDRWGQKNRSRTSAIAWIPITWDEIEGCLNSGLVAVGSHSHQHLNALSASDEQLAEEAGISREILSSRLGPDHASFYAYPYGSSRLGQVRTAYIGAVRKAGYQLAVTTDLGLALPNTTPLQIPRIEVHAYDSPGILQAKVRGHLWPHRFCDRFRQAKRQSN